MTASTRRSFSRRTVTRSIALGATALVLAGGTYGIVSATSGGGSGTATAATPAQVRPNTASAHAGGGSNARSSSAAGGSSGTVDTVSASGFALKTSTGQSVTVKETSSTAYREGTRSTSASAVTAGVPVLVLGTTDGTTITASQVIVRPPSSASPPSSVGTVVPFQRGAQSTSRQTGQIPASYQQGSGTIVSGTAANDATQAALAAYPGGIVDRVVQLSNGEYEVHNIGVNWPHHVFVNQDFKVVGAD